MGKSPKPLRILVHPGIAQWPEFQALREQGHTVIQLDEDHDVVLGPTCWLMDPKHQPYLSTAIATVRQRRYPKEKPK